MLRTEATVATKEADCSELQVSVRMNRSSSEAHFLAFRSTFKRPVGRFGISDFTIGLP